MKPAGTIVIQRDERATFHTYISPADGDMVCSHVVETENKLVIVDVQLLKPYAEELRGYVDRLGKPVERVIITHIHPDHWMGLEIFQDIPIYSLRETIDGLEKYADQLIEFKRPVYGDLIASHKVIPAHIIQEGTENIDGLTFQFTKVIDAEIDVMLAVEFPELGAIIAQDLIYNRVYLCVGEQNSQGEYMFDGWINGLKSIQEKGYETILSGHGEPTDSTIIPELIEYISYAKRIFQEGSGDEKQKRKLMERYPHYCVPEMLDLSNLFLYHHDW